MAGASRGVGHQGHGRRPNRTRHYRTTQPQPALHAPGALHLPQATRAHPYPPIPAPPRPPARTLHSLTRSITAGVSRTAAAPSRL